MDTPPWTDMWATPPLSHAPSRPSPSPSSVAAPPSGNAVPSLRRRHLPPTLPLPHIPVLPPSSSPPCAATASSTVTTTRQASDSHPSVPPRLGLLAGAPRRDPWRRQAPSLPVCGGRWFAVRNADQPTIRAERPTPTFASHVGCSNVTPSPPPLLRPRTASVVALSSTGATACLGAAAVDLPMQAVIARGEQRNEKLLTSSLPSPFLPASATPQAVGIDTGNKPGQARPPSSILFEEGDGRGARGWNGDGQQQRPAGRSSGGGVRPAGNGRRRERERKKKGWGENDRWAPPVARPP